MEVALLVEGSKKCRDQETVERSVDLRERENAREVEVETHQSTFERLTDIIQPLQQKLQCIIQPIEVESWERVHSECVEELNAQVEEVAEEVTKAQQMVTSFQDKEPENDNKNWIATSEWDTSNPW